MNAMDMRFDKVTLMRDIDVTWTRLNDALSKLTEAQMTEIFDPQGWAVRDHLVHIAAWERSVVVHLQGKSRHEGLGIPKELFLSGDIDATNTMIQEVGKARSIAEALADMHRIHSQLLALLEPLGDDDLARANSDYAPSVSGQHDGRPVSGMIFANTADHFREHHEWIESLVSKGG